MDITLLTQLNEISTTGLMARLFTKSLTNQGHKVKISPLHGHSQTFYSTQVPSVGTTPKYHCYFGIPTVAQPVQPQASIYKPSATFPLSQTFEMVYRRYANVFINNAAIRELMLETKPSYSLNTLLPPIEPELITTAQKNKFNLVAVPSDYIKILMCGKFIARKNFLDAFSTFYTNLRDLKAAIIIKVYPPNSGEFPHKILDQLAELIGRLKQPANLKVYVIADHLTDENWLRLLASIDIYATVSKLQDLDLTALLAGRLGKTVVLPQGLGYDEPFAPEQTAILYGPNSLEPIIDPNDSGGVLNARWGRINLTAFSYALRAAYDDLATGKNTYGPKAQEHLTNLLDPKNTCQAFLNALLKPYGDAR